ncbi:Tachykinin-like peptides receptor 86C [Sarcoptes scabiei]|uniref:Tachykinin-like peptides receptor 86C n=1 Tax=Sarcoptes scabiei TaxID=52283 RepID=A0A834R6E1_SARSC|nr:Tachykinin-like peptides receptor 86C [Sarcoptes scabiei]
MIYNTIKQYDVNDTGDAFNPYLFSTSSSSSSSSTLLSTTTTASITVRINNETENVLDQQIPFDCQEEFFDVENFTDLNFPGEIYQTKNYGLDEYFKISIYIIAILASLFGNSAVVICIFLKRSLRITVNLYLANLAVADILICVCCMWVHLVNHLTAPAYVLGPFLCKINSFAQMTCLTSSVLSLSAIACDRYMAIMYPLRARVTKQKTGFVIFSIWIISLIISIPFYLSRRYETFKWINYTQTTCLEEWPYKMVYSSEENGCTKKHTLKTFYYTLVSTTLFFGPVLIMLTTYSAIIWILWGSKLPGEASENNLRHQKKSKRKVIKMVVVVLLVFVICWLPLQIILLYSIYFHSSNETLPSWFSNLIFYSYFIAYSNSVFNPLIYGGFNKNFRDALCKNSLCKSFCNQNSNGRRRRRRRRRPITQSYGRRTLFPTQTGAAITMGGMMIDTNRIRTFTSEPSSVNDGEINVLNFGHHVDHLNDGEVDFVRPKHHQNHRFDADYLEDDDDDDDDDEDDDDVDDDSNVNWQQPSIDQKIEINKSIQSPQIVQS